MDTPVPMPCVRMEFLRKAHGHKVNEPSRENESRKTVGLYCIILEFAFCNRFGILKQHFQYKRNSPRFAQDVLKKFLKHLVLRWSESIPPEGCHVQTNIQKAGMLEQLATFLPVFVYN